MMKKNTKICIVLYLCYFAIHFLISMVSKMPLIWDEAGYMGIASKIATGAGNGFGYYGGYSLLIAPAYWLSKDTFVIYRIIQVINALIISFLPVLSYLFICKFNNSLSLAKKLIAVAAVCTYPGYLISSNLALPEGTFAVLFTLLLYLAYDIINQEKYTFKSLLPLAALYVFLCFVHPRALPVIFILIGFIIYKKVKFTKKAIVVIGISAAVLITAFFIVMHQLTGSENINISHLSSMIMDTVSFQGIWSFLSSFITQFGYLILSTFGLVILGFYALFRKGRNREGRIFIGLSFLSVMVLSAIFMKHIERADHVLYGRYNEGALVPLLICGLVFILTAKIEKKWLANSALISAFVFVFTIIFRWEPLHTLTMNYVNAVPSLYITKLFLPSFHLIWTYLIFAVFILAFVLTAKKNRLAGLCLLIALNTGFTLYMNFDYFPAGYQDRSGQMEIVQKLKEYRDKNGELYVNFEKSTQDAYWHELNYSIYIPDIHIEEFESFDKLPYPDSSLIITTKEDSRPSKGVKIAAEKNISIALWDTSLTESTELAANKGMLSPLAYRSDFKTTLEDGDSYSINEKFSFETDITHTGSSSLWSSFPYVRDMRSTVRLALNIYDDKFNEVYANRYDLGKNIAPGETVALTPYIESWDLAYIKNTYGEGKYLMHLELVQDYTTWFSQQNDNGLFNAELTFQGDQMIIGSTNYVTALPKSAYQFKNVRPYLLFGIDPKNTNKDSYINNLVNIKGDYTRAADAEILNISMPVDGETKIVLETKGKNPYNGDIQKAGLKLYINGLECPFIEFSKNSYYFSLPESVSEITEIKIHSNTYSPTHLPSFLGFQDNSPYLYTYFMKGIRKITGMETDGNLYGIDINQIYLDQNSTIVSE